MDTQQGEAEQRPLRNAHNHVLHLNRKSPRHHHLLQRWYPPPVTGTMYLSPSLESVEADILALVDQLVASVAGMPKLPHAAAHQVPLGSNPAAAAAANISSGKAIPTNGVHEAHVVKSKQVGTARA